MFWNIRIKQVKPNARTATNWVLKKIPRRLKEINLIYENFKYIFVENVG